MAKAFSGKIRIRLKAFEMQDDAPGLTECDTAGVGRTLMSAFAKQLRGQAEMIEAPGGGSVARFAFPTPGAAAPGAH